MTSYSEYISELLRPKETERALVLDLFAGCGGLSLGFEAAGFKTVGFEMLGAASESYNSNLRGKCYSVRLEVGSDYPDADIIIGGPPCQPFSVRGKQLGMKDARDGFPIFIDAVSRLQPKVFLFENVRNLYYTHRWYLGLIEHSLKRLGYIIEYRVLNAVDFEVPQNRERLILVGHRSRFTFPQSKRGRITVGDAIGDTMHHFEDDSKFLTPAQDRYIAEYERKSACINPRDLYEDRPARTITCRNLAGATSDMQRVRLPDGRRRRITPREAARLQSFPDWFEFAGTETEQFNQIGNAVPPMLAYHIAKAVKATYHLEMRSVEDILEQNRRFSSLFATV